MSVFSRLRAVVSPATALFARREFWSFTMPKSNMRSVMEATDIPIATKVFQFKFSEIGIPGARPSNLSDYHRSVQHHEDVF